jgi:hypothetical protein
MARESKIKRFIRENDLTIDSFFSELNSSCVIIAGYACHLKLDEETLIKRCPVLDHEAEEELRRVFRYARDNNYGDFWKTDKAKALYTF